MTPQASRRGASIAVLALLTLALLGYGVYRLTRITHKHDGAPQPATVTNVFAPRHYAEPHVSLEALGLDEQDISDEEAEAATSAFKPREDRPVWELKLPIDWAADPFKDRNWQFQLHSLGMTKPLLARYAATGDAARFRQALAFALDWWSFHRERKEPTAYSWYDMATGLRASIVAYLLDRSFSGREKLTDKEQVALLEMAEAHVTRLRKPKFIVMTNHGLFQIQGLASLCRVIGDVGECSGWDPYVQEKLTALLDSQFDEYGVHREHSPQYHRLAMEALQRFAQPKGDGVYKKIAERLELAHAVFPWLVFPGGRLAALGDTEGEAPSEPPPAARTCTTNANPDCVEVGDFSRSGYVVIRSPWAQPLKQAFMLIMTGTYNRGTHKHADDLSFELMEQGELLFEDTGKYAYLKDKMNNHVHAARAHSTVGLADREIDKGDTKPYGSALQAPERDADVHVLRGNVKRGKLFSQARRIDYAPGRYLLIDDELKSTASQNYESYLHLAPKLQPQQVGADFVVPLADGRSMRIESLSPDCKASQARGQTEPQRQGWVTKAYREMTPATALTFGCPGKRRHITLLVSFDSKARAAGVARAKAVPTPAQ